ncbi:MAG: hypothetical protein KatS3mg114_0962 [Planctomycetaceae bacterium]|nr:MAG: hypothetical protein KatS3mg114_0962 [Planctomycetaceae bacterium]
MRTAYTLAALAMTLAMGCAPAYRCYSGCHVNCRYCPPPPLPYVCYPGCVCHSCAASQYLSLTPTSVEGADDQLQREQDHPKDHGQP